MAVKPIPDGYTPVTPYIITKDPEGLLRFVKAAFNAEIREEHRDASGRIAHADFTINGAHVMVGGANDQWPEKLGSIMLYVPDADAVYRAALAAGAKSLYEPTNHFYGDRSAGIVDPSGISWWISTHVEDVSREEMERRMKAGQRG